MKKELEHLTDTELCAMLRDSKQVQERAFGELYSRWSQRLYLYTKKVFGDSHDAEDVFQETWMKFFNSVQNSEKAIDHVAGLLFTIARNLCINKQRSQREFVNVEEYHALVYDVGYEQKEMAALIHRAIEVLPHEYKEAFVLHELDGLSYDEIAQITKQTHGTLRIRVWRARQMVKEVLLPYLKEE